MQTTSIQKPSSFFIWRRLHSLMGFWLVLYLIEHLLVNSQAALWIGEDGHGFIRMVNSLESLPYLQVIEICLIGIPFGVHIWWGIARAWNSKMNSAGTGEKSPHLPYSRNKAYSWQRITSWILLVGVLGHVIQMRFINMPQKIAIEHQEHSLVKISEDPGLQTLAPRLGVSLYSTSNLPSLETTLQKSLHLKPGEVWALAPNPGTGILLMVRDTFKNPLMAVLYTIFLLAAVFHACNGFWTFLITWGAVLSAVSQKAMLRASMFGMVVLTIWGLAAIWGSYWINLKT